MPKAPPAKRKRGRPPVVGLAERRSDEILDIATGVFARHGYACTDLQIVADKLGVGKGTLYRYFPSKQRMFQAALDRVLTGMRTCVDASMDPAADPLDQLSAIVRAYLAYFDAHPEYVELIIQERSEFRDRKKPTYFQHREAHLGRWHEFYRSLIADGRIRDIPVSRISDVMSNAIFGAMFTNYFTGHDKTLAEQADSLLDIILYGLLTPRESARRQRSKESFQ